MASHPCGAAYIQRALSPRDIPPAALPIYNGRSARATSHPRRCRYTKGTRHARHPMCESRRDTDGIQPAHTPPNTTSPAAAIHSPMSGSSSDFIAKPLYNSHFLMYNNNNRSAPTAHCDRSLRGVAQLVARLLWEHRRYSHRMTTKTAENHSTVRISGGTENKKQRSKMCLTTDLTTYTTTI